MTTRRTYQLNYSDLRAFGRFERTPERREAKIREAVKARDFWATNGSSEGAKAALRVAHSRMQADVVASIAAFLDGLTPAPPGIYRVAREDVMRALSQLRYGAIRCYPTNLPRDFK